VDAGRFGRASVGVAAADNPEETLAENTVTARTIVRCAPRGAVEVEEFREP
jgi:hypothetical protein